MEVTRSQRNIAIAISLLNGSTYAQEAYKQGALVTRIRNIFQGTLGKVLFSLNVGDLYIEQVNSLELARKNKIFWINLLETHNLDFYPTLHISINEMIALRIFIDLCENDKITCN